MQNGSMIRRGTEYLDNRYGPDWANRIDVSRLNISHPDRCIIAQLEGNYNDVRHQLGLSHLEEQTHGFFVSGPQGSNPVLEEYAVLTADWREEIFRRQEEAMTPAPIEAVQEERAQGEREEELVCV